MKHNTSDNRIPEGVTDELMYRKYVELTNKLYQDNYTKYETSDANIVINLLATKPFVIKKISPLPEKEQSKILKIHARLSKLRGRMVSTKRKAFGNSGKLSVRMLKPRQAEMIEYFGRFYTISEVHQIVAQRWGLADVTVAQVQKFRLDNISLIKQRQEEFRRDFSDIRLGYKRGRLEEYLYLYRTRKDIYKRGYNLSDSREMRAILESVRKEIEGDKITIDADFKIHQDKQMEMHVYGQLMKSMSIKTVIISRVAARLGIPVDKLLERMMTSFYSKFTGFGDNRPQQSDIDKIYPSRMIYDFEKLEKEAGSKVRLNDLVEDANVVEEKDADKKNKQSLIAENRKAKLINLLLREKGKMINSQDEDNFTDKGRR